MGRIKMRKFLNWWGKYEESVENSLKRRRSLKQVTKKKEIKCL